MTLIVKLKGWSHVVTFLSEFSLLTSLVTHDSYNKALEVCNQNNFH